MKICLHSIRDRESDIEREIQRDRIRNMKVYSLKIERIKFMKGRVRERERDRERESDRK